MKLKSNKVKLLIFSDDNASRMTVRSVAEANYYHVKDYYYKIVVSSQPIYRGLFMYYSYINQRLPLKLQI